MFLCVARKTVEVITSFPFLWERLLKRNILFIFPVNSQIIRVFNRNSVARNCMFPHYAELQYIRVCVFLLIWNRLLYVPFRSFLWKNDHSPGTTQLRESKIHMGWKPYIFSNSSSGSIGTASKYTVVNVIFKILMFIISNTNITSKKTPSLIHRLTLNVFLSLWFYLNYSKY